MCPLITEGKRPPPSGRPFSAGSSLWTSRCGPSSVGQSGKGFWKVRPRPAPWSVALVPAEGSPSPGVCLRRCARGRGRWLPPPDLTSQQRDDVSRRLTTLLCTEHECSSTRRITCFIVDGIPPHPTVLRPVDHFLEPIARHVVHTCSQLLHKVYVP